MPLWRHEDESAYTSHEETTFWADSGVANEDDDFSKTHEVQLAQIAWALRKPGVRMTPNSYTAVSAMQSVSALQSGLIPMRQRAHLLHNGASCIRDQTHTSPPSTINGQRGNNSPYVQKKHDTASSLTLLPTDDEHETAAACHSDGIVKSVVLWRFDSAHKTTLRHPAVDSGISTPPRFPYLSFTSSTPSGAPNPCCSTLHEKVILPPSPGDRHGVEDPSTKPP